MIQSKLHIGDDILSISGKMFLHFAAFSMKTFLFLHTANPIFFCLGTKLWELITRTICTAAYDLYSKGGIV